MEKLTNQSEWIERAKEVLPAGGFGNFDPSIFIREGRGSRVWDEDGNEYADEHGVGTPNGGVLHEFHECVLCGI